MSGPKLSVHGSHETVDAWIGRDDAGLILLLSISGHWRRSQHALPQGVANQVLGTVTPASSASRTSSATDPACIFSMTRARCTLKAMKAGAVDLLTKPVDARDLIAAIQRAVTRDEHDRAAEARRAEVQRCVGRLTPRETEVFALVVTGLLNNCVRQRPR
jgi:hypothetical protein